MLKITKAQVWKYKSIEDSTPVDIAEDVTVLVGKNESGKTAFLEALYKSLAHEGVKFDFVFDYPRKDYVRYRQQHEAKLYAKVVELTFAVPKELADKINREVFGGKPIVPEGHLFTRTTHYGNGNSVGFTFNGSAALAALKKPLEGLEHTEEVFAGADSIDDVIPKIEAKQLAADSNLV